MYRGKPDRDRAADGPRRPGRKVRNSGRRPFCTGRKPPSPGRKPPCLGRRFAQASLRRRVSAPGSPRLARRFQHLASAMREPLRASLASRWPGFSLRARVGEACAWAVAACVCKPSRLAAESAEASIGHSHARLGVSDPRAMQKTLRSGRSGLRASLPLTALERPPDTLWRLLVGRGGSQSLGIRAWRRYVQKHPDAVQLRAPGDGR